MKLELVSDDLDNAYFEKRISENGLVSIAIHPVLFGWRVRAWFTNQEYCVLDWCAGDNQEQIERLYSLLYNILSYRTEDVDCFSDLPMASKIKPFFNDFDFVDLLLKKLTTPFEKIKLRDINKLRASSMPDNVTSPN